MKKTILFLSGLLILSTLLFSFVDKPTNNSDKQSEISTATIVKGISLEKDDHKAAAASLSTNLFNSLQLEKKGLSQNTLEVAVKGYLHLQEQGALKNTDLLSIVDFSQSSRKKRFYLLDMKNNKLLVNTYVAHGKNSGLDLANSFSNTIGSEKSSLGFYLTKGTYTGKNGFSLRMEGLDKGFNDNAEARAIVVHGADYVNQGRTNSAYMGRSQGCPALPRADYIKVIDLIKDGSALFVYSLSENYLETSEILNS